MLKLKYWHALAFGRWNSSSAFSIEAMFKNTLVANYSRLFQAIGAWEMKARGSKNFGCYVDLYIPSLVYLDLSCCCKFVYSMASAHDGLLKSYETVFYQMR